MKYLFLILFLTACAGPSIKPVNEFDLRPYAFPAQNQGDSDHCTSYAIASAMEVSLKHQTKLSESAIWDNYRLANFSVAVAQTLNKPIPGSNGSGTFTGIDSNGITLIRKVTTEDEIKSSLKAGHGVAISLEVPQDLEDCKPIVTANSPLSPGIGHSVAIIAWEPGYYWIKNSFGSNCGDNGFQRLEVGALDRVQWQGTEIAQAAFLADGPKSGSSAPSAHLGPVAHRYPRKEELLK